MSYSSKLFQNAIESFASLPGIGKKSAMRFVLHLMKDKANAKNNFLQGIYTFLDEIKFCKRCNNISDDDFCHICSDYTRDQQLLCLVESIKDVIAIEDTMQYRGQYFVLGGVISPLDGVGADDIPIQQLLQLIEKQDIRELIFGLNPSVEGDTTNYYISQLLKSKDIKISQLARGISFGGELEYADKVTLGRSLVSRIDYRI